MAHGHGFGYSQSNTQINALASSAEVDGGLVAAYAATHFGELNLRMGATYGFNNIDTTRSIAFPGFFDRTRANYNADTGQVFGEFGYATAWNAVALEPFANVAWVHLDTASFTESGGEAALSGSGSAEDVGYSALGVRAATSYALSNGQVLIPHLSIAWQYAIGDLTPAASLAFSGISGSNFSVVGVPLSRNAALVDAGADLRIGPDAKIGISYSGQLADDASDNAITGNLLWNF